MLAMIHADIDLIHRIQCRVTLVTSGCAPVIAMADALCTALIELVR